MKMLIVVGALILAGCAKDPEVRTQANGNFAVDRLFTNNGCTVYRFSDGGRLHYYSDCRGRTTSTWTESCGKNCSRSVTDEVETAR